MVDLALYDELAFQFREPAKAGVDWLAPAVVARCCMALRELGHGRAEGISSARSTAQQKRLYDAWRRGDHHVAVVATPGTSRHEPGGENAKPITSGVAEHLDERIPRDGWAVAVDVAPKRRTTSEWRALERAMLNWGMRLTVGVLARNADGSVRVPTANHEPWHFEPNPGWRPDMLRSITYLGVRIAQLPGAPSERRLADQMRWLRERENRSDHGGSFDMWDMITLTGMEAWLVGQARGPLP